MSNSSRVVANVDYGRDDFPQKLHYACEECIASTRKKYKGFTSDDGTHYVDGFSINCPFIPHSEEFYPEKLKTVLPPTDWKEVNSLRSALLWAESNLLEPESGKPWRAWPHQRGPLMCLSPRKVYRFGRRCIPGHVLVLMASGLWKRMDSIQPGEYVISRDDEAQFVGKRVVDFWENGEKDVYRITLTNGMWVDCTSNHPLLACVERECGNYCGVAETWMSIEDGLHEGVKVCTLKEGKTNKEGETKKKDTSRHQEFVSIKSIERIGVQPTFDIEVEDTHNFISNGICTHNTGKTTILAIEALWFVFTSGGGQIRDPDTGAIRNNLKVLILAKQKTHITNIFDRMKEFIHAVPGLTSCVARKVGGSPEILKLTNGSQITGFASGDSSGSNGVAARGQDADLVILDEGAFISGVVIKQVVSPILYTEATTRLVVSSTPSGIPGDFFETACMQRPDFAEFYVPATMIPHWDQIKDQIGKDIPNEEDWNQEVLAKFSPAGIGVYKEELIKMAQDDFKYGEARNNPNFVYTVGVDWNKEHGTEIVVVATLKVPPHTSFVVYAENIPKEEFTTPSGVGRIVELNKIWLPHWIYVDAGGGEGGAMLKHHGRSMVGKDIVAARLMNNVKTYDFGSKIEVRNVEGVRKVPSKPFMVDHSVRKFELGEIRYPRDDTLLTKQLYNYIVVRRNNGVPVYGIKEPKWGDHRLDALNLALVALRLEFHSFYDEGITPMGIGIRPIQRDIETVQEVANRRVKISSVGGVASTSSRAAMSRTPGRMGNRVVVSWGEEPPDEAWDNYTAYRSRGRRGRLFER